MRAGKVIVSLFLIFYYFFYFYFYFIFWGGGIYLFIKEIND